MAWERVEHLMGYTCSYSSEYSSPEDIPSQSSGDTLVLGNAPSTLNGVGNGEWHITSNLYVTTQLSNTLDAKNRGSLYLNSVDCGGWIGLAYTGSKADFIFFIDEANEEGDAFFVSYLPQLNIIYYGARVDQTHRHNLYLELKSAAPSPYTWSTVPTITGKGKTYALSRIANGRINDGYATSGASVSAFSVLNDGSKVSVLIADVIQDITKVTAEYTIPEGTYDYIKLVYKKDSIPVDKDDGTAIDILQSSTSQVISGIADGNTYWFVIFTDKTSSNAKDITTILVE